MRFPKWLNFGSTIIAGTSRHLFLRGQIFGGSQLAVISFGTEGPSLTRAIPSFWIERVLDMLSQ
jgi:hypothetical protein